MSTLRNRVQLIGHVGADPEIKTLESGVKVARLRVATNDRYKTSNGEWKDDTQWHTVTAWGNLTNRIEQYVKKGSFLALDGKIDYREYTDQQGVKKYFTEIRANSLIILDKKQDGSNESTTDFNAQEDDSVLPF